MDLVSDRCAYRRPVRPAEFIQEAAGRCSADLSTTEIIMVTVGTDMRAESARLNNRIMVFSR